MGIKSKEGKILIIKTLQNAWTGRYPSKKLGIVPTLVKEGKVKQYLRLYATRHTYISNQVNVFGIPPEVIAQWCGHHEKVSKESYIERNKIIKSGRFTTGNTQQTHQQLPNQVTDFLANLTLEQIEQLKSLLNK